MSMSCYVYVPVPQLMVMRLAQPDLLHRILLHGLQVYKKTNIRQLIRYSKMKHRFIVEAFLEISVLMLYWCIERKYRHVVTTVYATLVHKYRYYIQILEPFACVEQLHRWIILYIYRAVYFIWQVWQGHKPMWKNTCSIILYTLWLKTKLHTCIIPCNTTLVRHID